MPGYVNAQNSDRISLLDNFGSFDKGESLFIFGSLTNVLPDAFLILQIVNPAGDLCQIQQLRMYQEEYLQDFQRQKGFLPCQKNQNYPKGKFCPSFVH